MIKAVKYTLKTIWNFIKIVLMYIFLMIDRLILVPFPFVTSHNIDEYAKAESRTLGAAILRVIIAIVIAWIIFLIKWIF